MVRRWLSIAFAICATAILVVPPAAALVLPTPRAFVSNLDLDCFKTNPYQPPTTTLTLRHLNPQLGDLPIQQVTLGAREQLCVPVAKNNVIPPPGVLDFVRFVDLSCYRVTGPSVNRTLVLHHLNPVLQNQPRKQVVLNQPQQLCVPVVKNGVVPSAEVLSVIRHIDLECYGFTPNPLMNQVLNLRQLNPVLANVPPANVQVLAARQLCVPVQKRGDEIPAATLNIVRWLDLEKYDVGAAATAPITLNLRHLNPVLGHLPGETATLTGRNQLAVPVAKNGMIPPG
ncbi:hypothetical protein ACIBEJ_29870 [Nonomuraea sp. NPDC050790]|uniref:hypothetical protein n=1 Tax=Nonomuraea sp. NPDC050790 TaxID=3364371 RepID=UPI0037A73119